MALHRLTALALTGVLAVGASGCGGDSPHPSPSTSSAAVSPTPTSSGPAAPVLPDLAARHDDVGAKAFVRFYFGAISYAIRTGDTSVMDRYAGTDCEACAGISSKIARIREAGARNTGGAWRIDVLVRSGLWTRDLPAFGVAYQEQKKALWDRDGKLVDRDPAAKRAVNVWVSRSGSSWKMREIQQVKGEGQG